MCYLLISIAPWSVARAESLLSPTCSQGQVDKITWPIAYYLI